MSEKEPAKPPPQCSCMRDPNESLPPELRPRKKSPLEKGGFRKIACPGCGLVYWTNRATDLCVDCEKRA